VPDLQRQADLGFQGVQLSLDPAQLGAEVARTLGEWAAFLAGVRNGEFDGDVPAGRP
jgi:hypothetical protein